MTRVVLGSASTGRLGVLRQAGIDPVVAVSGVDEDAVIAGLDPDAGPEEVVVALATAKATEVAAALPAALRADCVVIGCDSMLAVNGRLGGKPGSAAAALSQWKSMRGTAGQLHTGHCVVRLQDGEMTHREAESRCTTVHFGTPADDELAAYVASGEPLHVAGGFTLDGRGGWFIDRIEGDPSNVIGLSLPLTRALLARVGVAVTGLWGAPA